MVYDRLREAGLTAHSKTKKKDRKGKARRPAEAKINDMQLCSVQFTKFMDREQGGCEQMTAKHFTVDNRKMRRRVRAAINAMEKHKAAGVDNTHAEMLRVAPKLFARILTSMWETIGTTLLITEGWNAGVLVPPLKSGTQTDATNYRFLCILSHIRKSWRQRSQWI